MAKTILHISKYYYPDLGGIETVATYLAEGLTDYRNIVVCFSPDNQYHEDIVHGIRVYRVPVLFSVMSQDVSLAYYGILRKLLRLYSPWAVHVHCPNPLVYPMVCNLVPSDVKVVLHWHSDILSKGLAYQLVRPLERAILRRSDVVLSTSPNYIEQSAPLQSVIDKVRVVQNGIIESLFDMQPGDADRIRDLRARYGNHKIVFTCGRHIPYKGLDLLLQADRYIEPDCMILIGGTGPVDTRLHSMSCSGRVLFLGRLSAEELRLHLHAADVFAFPSCTKAEAFGIALAEAMYCQCAPVTFSIPGSGVNWVSLSDVTGLEVSLGDVMAFAEAINTLLSDADRRSRFAQASHQRVIDMFTRSSAVSAMRDVYDSLKDSNE